MRLKSKVYSWRVHTLCLPFLGSDHPRLVPGHVLHGAPVGPSQGKFVCHGLVVVTRPGVYAMLKSG